MAGINPSTSLHAVYVKYASSFEKRAVSLEWIKEHATRGAVQRINKAKATLGTTPPGQRIRHPLYARAQYNGRQLMDQAGYFNHWDALAKNKDLTLQRAKTYQSNVPKLRSREAELFELPVGTKLTDAEPRMQAQIDNARVKANTRKLQLDKRVQLNKALRDVNESAKYHEPWTMDRFRSMLFNKNPLPREYPNLQYKDQVPNLFR